MGGAVGGFLDDVVGIDDSGGIVGSVSDAGADLDDFVNEEIPGGWTTVAVVAGGTALASGALGGATAGTAAGAGTAGGVAGGTGLTIGAGGATGLTAGTTAAGIGGGALGTGLTVGGLTAAELAAAGTAAAGLGTAATALKPGLTAAELASSTATGGLTGGPSIMGLEGTTGLVPGSTGAGFTATGAGAPGLTSMGGGQGLLTGAAGGGTLGATGVTAAGSTAVLGELGSLVNNPQVLGQGIIGVDATGNAITGTVLSDGSFIDQAGRLFNQAGDLVKQFTQSELGQILGGAAQTYINQEFLSNLADEQRQLGAQTAARAEQLGAAAAVPFTPYTVTTGLGTSTVSPTGATAQLAAPYQAISEQTAQQAQQAFGAINPAQASQTLYGQLEALQAPGRQIEQNRLLGTLGQKGLLGFGQNLPTVGGQVQAVNPYVQSLLTAQETARGQNALAAQQYGTSEAQRQAALGSSLLGVGTGLEAQAAQRLGQAGTLGIGLTQLGQTDAGRALGAGLSGLEFQTKMNLNAADIEAARQRALASAASNTVGSVFGLPQTGTTSTGGSTLSNVQNLINTGQSAYNLYNTGSTLFSNLGRLF